MIVTCEKTEGCRHHVRYRPITYAKSHDVAQRVEVLSADLVQDHRRSGSDHLGPVDLQAVAK